MPSHTYTHICTSAPFQITSHRQFLLCCFNLDQLSWFSRFYFLFSVPLSHPLHSPGSQLGLNTHRRFLRTNINCSALEDWVGSVFKCVIWGAWKYMLKILLQALVLDLVIVLPSLSLAVMIFVSLSTSFFFCLGSVYVVDCQNNKISACNFHTINNYVYLHSAKHVFTYL